MRRKSDKSKIREGYGTGTHEKYKPFVRVSEFSSQGTCSNPIDWKTGRTVHLLSQGEKQLWYILRFMDEVDDIREQYPLDLTDTLELAKSLGITHPYNQDGPSIMTTDLFVDMKNGQQIALSVKDNRDDVNSNPRTIEKLYLEQQYWKEKGITWKLIYKEDLNEVYAKNIEDVSYYFSYEYVCDDISFIKYLIANKCIMLDMQSELLDFKELANYFISDKTIKELEESIKND